jgi:hypothetical protein
VYWSCFSGASGWSSACAASSLRVLAVAAGLPPTVALHGWLLRLHIANKTTTRSLLSIRQIPIKDLMAISRRGPNYSSQQLHTSPSQRTPCRPSSYVELAFSLLEAGKMCSSKRVCSSLYHIDHGKSQSNTLLAKFRRKVPGKYDPLNHLLYAAEAPFNSCAKQHNPIYLPDAQVNILQEICTEFISNKDLTLRGTKQRQRRPGRILYPLVLDLNYMFLRRPNTRFPGYLFTCSP